VVAWLTGLTKASEPRVQYRTGETIRLAFAGAWTGEAQAQYSVVLAQSAALSARWRRSFLVEATGLFDERSRNKLRRMAELKASVQDGQFPSSLGPVYIFLRSADFLLAGIENEAAACLRKKPHLRYDEYLSLRNARPLLMLLAASGLQLDSHKAGRLDRFVPARQGQIVGWADGCLTDWLEQSATSLEEVFRGAASLF
jgi:hypothetical protein